MSTIHEFSKRTSTRSAYEGVAELLRVEAPADEVEALFTKLVAVRGAHRVEVRTSWRDDPRAGGAGAGWRRITFRGTERAVLGAKNVLAMSGLQHPDPNADHDHERCIRAAREQGVPAWSAHNVERYLST